MPPSAASATGLRIAPLGICISCTDATAGSNDGRSRASALRVLGTDLAGGGSSGTGSRSGALVAVRATPIFTLAIAEWLAETRANRSHSNAALIDLVILPDSHGAGPHHQDTGGTATVCVIDTDSDDTNATPENSDTGRRHRKHAGHSSGDAAKADAGDGALMLALGHSDASNDGMGTAYVAGVGKQEVLSSQQSGEEIPVKIPGVDVIKVHHDPGDIDSTQSSVVQADDTAAQPERPGPIADAVTASAASMETPATGPQPALPPATGGSGESVGAAAAALGIPGTGASLGAAGGLLLVSGGLLAASSAWRRPTP